MYFLSLDLMNLLLSRSLYLGVETESCGWRERSIWKGEYPAPHFFYQSIHPDPISDQKLNQTQST
jgi:hypothetical protein